MRAASTAALRALSTPTQATGTPGGICAIDSSASSPPATDVDDVERHADHRQVGVGGDDAGQRGRQAGAGDDHLAGRACARSSRSRRPARGRGGPTSRGPRARMPRSVELLGRLLHRRHVALGAHDDADARRVDLDALELGLDLGLSRWFAHAAMSRRSSCRRSRSRRRQHTRRARAVARVVAERGHVEHAPAGGDDRAVALARCRRA